MFEHFPVQVEVHLEKVELYIVLNFVLEADASIHNSTRFTVYRSSWVVWQGAMIIHISLRGGIIYFPDRSPIYSSGNKHNTKTVLQDYGTSWPFLATCFCCRMAQRNFTQLESMECRNAGCFFVCRSVGTGEIVKQIHNAMCTAPLCLDRQVIS